MSNHHSYCHYHAGTTVLSLGNPAAVPGYFSRRLGVLLPEGYMALAEEKVTGKMFRFEIIKAEPDRLKYKVSLIQHDLLNDTLC